MTPAEMVSEITTLSTTIVGTEVISTLILAGAIIGAGVMLLKRLTKRAV